MSFEKWEAFARHFFANQTEVTEVKGMPALKDQNHIACYPESLIRSLESEFPDFKLVSARYNFYPLIALEKLQVEFISSSGETFECQLNLGNRPHRNDVVFKCTVNTKEPTHFTPSMCEISYITYQLMLIFMRQKSPNRLPFVTGTIHYQIPSYIKELALERKEAWEF